MKLQPLITLVITICLSACGGGGGGGSDNLTYTVSGNVTGLSGSGLVLTNYGSGNVPVFSNGPVSIVSGVSVGMTYRVGVGTQPTNPWQTCTITNGSGTMGASNVSNVTVSCATNTYSVGGQVQGLTGSGLVVSNNGGENMPVPGPSLTNFAYTLASGSRYSFGFASQPTNPSQTCVFQMPPTGTVGGSAMANLNIGCTTNSYTVGGTVSGLSGTGFALSLNGGPSLTVSANGAFTFASPLLSGSQYSVAVAAQPTGANVSCSVSNGAGTIQSGAVNNVTAVCAPTSGGGGQVIATPGPPNVESLVVDSGPGALTTPAVNTSFISVTVCLPGTTSCQTIDHIEVDTGSNGLRILAGAQTATGAFNLALPAVADPSTAGNVLAECLQFADGFSWGSLNTADIKLPVSGKTATNVIVHMIGASSAGDPAKASPTCVPPPPLVTENTVPSFGANGVLGVGPFINDCNSTSTCDPLPQVCNGTACYPGNSATYFSCTAAASCKQVAAGVITPQLQLPNPAVLFATDNNGVIIELPAVGAAGAPAPLNGSLVFGIGTETNNALGSATKLPMCPGTTTAGICGISVNGMTVPLAGTISASLNGATYQESYLDSGSNANFFPTTSIPGCQAPNQGFLCPTSTTSESATLTGTDGTIAAADFSVANANALFSANNAMNVAFSNLAGSNYSSSLPNESLDLGLSFFYGRNVFTGFENPATNTAPYVAY